MKYFLGLRLLFLLGLGWFYGAQAEEIASNNPVVRISTTSGDIVLELYPDKAPITVKNFLSYVGDDSYTDTVFHRVIPDFMIQAGGHLTDMTELEGKEEITNEADNGLSNLTGTIAMARTDIIDSASRQFFINTNDNTRLDHSAESCTREDEKATEAAAERGLIRPVTCKSFGYTVFGRVVRGMDVVRQIELVETKDEGDFYDVPVLPIMIKGMEKIPFDEIDNPVVTGSDHTDPGERPQKHKQLHKQERQQHSTIDSKPALVLLIAIDQLRNDRIDASLPGGLGKLAREGKMYTDASLDHGLTSTCPGHAVIMTGVNPSKAGIPGNYYIDTASWTLRYCVEDDAPEHLVLGGEEGRSPWMLTEPTLGQRVKALFNGRSFSVSGKDRAAIMMAGHEADGVYWFDKDQVRFTTSKFYEQSLPDYVNTFNKLFVDSLPLLWEHDAGRFRADDYIGESDDNSRVSGHSIRDGDTDELGERIYDSPYLDKLTFELARRIVTEEALGQKGVTDVLTISLSANDTVGHQYGPYSAESEHTLNIIDAELAMLLELLDQTVGEDRYIVALTSDHGVANLPEWQSELGKNRCPIEGGRIGLYGFVGGLLFDIYAEYTAPWDLPTDLVMFSGSQLYINRPYLAQNQLEFDQVVSGLRRILESEPGVKKLWTRYEIENTQSSEARLLRNSIVEGSSGDLFLQIEQDCIISNTGTTHGSLYDYDRSIPLIFYGQWVSPGVDTTPVNSIDIAPTLMEVLGIPLPSGLDGKALELSP